MMAPVVSGDISGSRDIRGGVAAVRRVVGGTAVVEDSRRA